MLKNERLKERGEEKTCWRRDPPQEAEVRWIVGEEKEHELAWARRIIASSRSGARGCAFSHATSESGLLVEGGEERKNQRTASITGSGYETKLSRFPSATTSWPNGTISVLSLGRLQAIFDRPPILRGLLLRFLVGKWEFCVFRNSFSLFVHVSLTYVIV